MREVLCTISKRPNRDASRRYHDRVARQYDSIYEDPYWAFHDELTWRLVKPAFPRNATHTAPILVAAPASGD